MWGDRMTSKEGLVRETPFPKGSYDAGFPPKPDFGRYITPPELPLIHKANFLNKRKQNIKYIESQKPEPTPKPKKV